MALKVKFCSRYMTQILTLKVQFCLTFSLPCMPYGNVENDQ